MTSCDPAEPSVEYISLVRFGDTGYTAQIILFGESKIYDIDGLRTLRDEFLDSNNMREIDQAIRDIELQPDLGRLPEMGNSPHERAMSAG